MPQYFDACTIISEQDRQLLPHPDKNRITVVPNGVDTGFFDPEATPPPLDSMRNRNPTTCPFAAIWGMLQMWWLLVFWHGMWRLLLSASLAVLSPCSFVVPNPQQP